MSEPRTFTDLPKEARHLIYRNLVTSDEPLSYVPKGRDAPQIPRASLGLHLNILSTCRKIYEEASPIVFSENTWVVNLFVRHGQSYAEWCGIDYYQRWPGRVLGRHLDSIRKLHVRVAFRDFAYEKDLVSVSAGVDRVATTLSLVRRLDHVHIELADPDGLGVQASPGEKTTWSFLDAFAQVYVRDKVTFRGIPLCYALSLREAMRTFKPQLPHMMHDLWAYAMLFDVDRILANDTGAVLEATGTHEQRTVRCLLTEAQNVADEGDEDGFKRLRWQIVQRLDEVTEKRRLRMVNYELGKLIESEDSQPEEDTVKGGFIFDHPPDSDKYMMAKSYSYRSFTNTARRIAFKGPDWECSDSSGTAESEQGKVLYLV
ncbi:hypothetical protein B0I35DRAFT_475945 [Stachybotrys elegans]|uniref:Uncharacterized protein n=1 Tax=Stachybotrys elegans TaxID=80388 RepID=A0A8K0SYB7_9HYPO|nr:hypothetical protein B0I35DRAFT_475945 [Stachybotrys elegans]